MRKRRRHLLALTLAGVAVAALVGVLYFLTSGPPLVYQAAYDRIQIGQPRDDAERLVPPVAAPPAPELPTASIGVARWEGLLDGRVQRTAVSGDHQFDDDPLLQRSRYVRWPQERTGPDEGDVVTYLTGTGAVL